MKTKSLRLVAMAAQLLLLPLALCAEDNFRLTIFHVNDIHAHLDPSPIHLATAPPLQVQVGGASRLATAFAQARLLPGNKLFLHGGDEFTGTPWFSVYKGLADAAVLNRLGFDAFVPGNHEFDQGPVVLGNFLDSLRTPALAANLDASREPGLRGKIRPALVRLFESRKVAIVGIAQPETPGISAPGPTLIFHTALSVQRTVDSLRKTGASIVILLSHAGLETDTVLARKLSGVSCIVGGHSHTRMGTVFSQIGLPTSLPYPLVIKGLGETNVPVVQAWEWGKEIGVLDLEFDKLGRAVSWEGHPFLPASSVLHSGSSLLPDSISLPLRRSLSCPGAIHFLAPDPRMDTLLAHLAKPLDSLRRATVANLPVSLSRKDGVLLEVSAKSLLQAGAKWGAQVGLMNNGGVRDDLSAGVVSREAVMKVAPFDNTVIIMTVTGAQLRQAVRILASEHSHRVGLSGASTDRSDEIGKSSLRLVGANADLLDSDTVRVATNSYLAGGGDGCRVLKEATGFRLDTQIRDADALADWLRETYPVR